MTAMPHYECTLLKYNNTCQPSARHDMVIASTHCHHVHSLFSTQSRHHLHDSCCWISFNWPFFINVTKSRRVKVGTKKGCAEIQWPSSLCFSVGSAHYASTRLYDDQHSDMIQNPIYDSVEPTPANRFPPSGKPVPPPKPKLVSSTKPINNTLSTLMNWG